MGWAHENLGPGRCREIAEGLFTVQKVYGTKLHGFCPIHGDQKSASFFYNFETDGFGCQSCGEKGDLINLWCLVNNLDRQDVRSFREEFEDGYSAGGGERKKKPAVPRAARPKAPELPEVFVPEEDLAALPPLPAERIEELGRIRGWSAEVISSLDLREFTDFKGGKRVAIPVRDDLGRLCNIRLYQPGAAEFKVISWYDQSCKACGGKWKTVNKKKICKACGAVPNDYGRTRLFPPPSAWKAGPVWLCEGEPDTVCALSKSLNAVTQTAGCGTWTEEFSATMAARDVVICYDADAAGFKGAHVAGKLLVEHARSVRVIVWPELMGQK